MKQDTRFTGRERSNRAARRRSSRLRRVLIILSVGLSLLALVLSARYLAQTNQQKQLQAQMRAELAAVSPLPPALPLPSATPDESTGTAAPATLAEPTINWGTPEPAAAMQERFVGLFGKNRDLVGWLKAEAVPDIDFAVVQRDNTYYLDHDFYGRSNQGGTVFLDEGAILSPRDDNLVLHGHNMKNGTMFGKLHRYLDAGFTAERPYFTFSTLYRTAQYVPYAVSMISIDPASPLHFSLLEFNFNNNESQASYAERLRAVSKLSLPVDVRPDDRLLTLVTCHGDEADERLIVALRELRPGEDPEALKTQIIRETSEVR